ncbi:uncharacterized protein TRUGW13939_08549 [Talaromyces rugulosus]|uniref:N-acetyltransferase domain-containing protein n=1 Tax=Talaromyces rugulosus TaxID=121627 RepID=A0A7H8R6P0_TALRU|nr:uncharacterized protein TRUGW13939_08549 [Talaromyces rugulosus]QKX61401.1 hypothetical protein TRUGW13939_08549 [Talaromyces rugulosus]
MSSQQTPSNIELREVTTRDVFDRVTDVIWTASHDPYNSHFGALHPTHGFTEADREEDKKAESERKWAEHERNPPSHWIYAVDISTDQVVGCAEWMIYAKNPFPNGPLPIPCRHYPEGSEAAKYVSLFLSQAFYPHMCWMARPHGALMALAVVPGHRNRGIGRMLMQWGHERIDPLGYESFIEGSVLGRWLYERCGYRRLMDIYPNMDVKSPSDEWIRLRHQWKPPVIGLFWRPPRGEFTDSTPHGPWEIT